MFTLSSYLSQIDSNAVYFCFLYLIFNALNDYTRILATEPAKKCWHSHCDGSGFREQKFLIEFNSNQITKSLSLFIILTQNVCVPFG